MASISLEASPPEAVLARGRGGSPGFSEIRNSTESIPVPLNARCLIGSPPKEGVAYGTGSAVPTGTPSSESD